MQEQNHSQRLSPFLLLHVNTLSCELAALYYAHELQWPVFPVRGKRPLTRRGFYDATRQEERIRQWWRQWPDAGIGLPTGERTELVVLDIDPRHGGRVALQQLQRRYGPLPPTCFTRTGGGGLHLLFAYPSDTCGRGRIPNATCLGGFAGIDLRASGGYIVAPPSRHACGAHYLWLRDGVVPVPLPLFLLDLACPPLPTSSSPPVSSPPASLVDSVARTSLSPTDRNTRHGVWDTSTAEGWRSSGDYWLHQAVQKAVPGTRNANGFWLACQLRDCGMSYEEASRVMQQYASEVKRGEDPYTEREALRSLSSAYRVAPRAPARALNNRTTSHWRGFE